MRTAGLNYELASIEIDVGPAHLFQLAATGARVRQDRYDVVQVLHVWRSLSGGEDLLQFRFGDGAGD
jgi:hypothetical protein